MGKGQCDEKKMARIPGLAVLKVALKVCCMIPVTFSSKLARSLVYVVLLWNWIEVIRCTPLPFLPWFSPELASTPFRSRVFHVFISLYVWNSAIIRSICAYLYTTKRGYKIMLELHRFTAANIQLAPEKTKKRIRNISIVTCSFLISFVLLNSTGAMSLTLLNPPDMSKTVYFYHNWFAYMGIKVPPFVSTLIMVSAQFFMDSSFVFNCLLLGIAICFAELFKQLEGEIKSKFENYNDEIEPALRQYDVIDLSDVRRQYLSIAKAVEKLDSISNFITLSSMSTIFFAVLLDIFVLVWNPPLPPMIYLWVLWLVAGILNLLLYALICSKLSHSSAAVIDTVLMIPNECSEVDDKTNQQILLFNSLSTSGGHGMSLFGIVIIKKEIVFTVGFFSVCFLLFLALFY